MPPEHRDCQTDFPPQPWHAACRSRACQRDLALRRQQRAEPAEAWAKRRNVRGDEAVEKVAGVNAADLDHAPVGKKRCFHKVFSGKVLLEVVGETQLPDIPWQRKPLRYREQGPRDIRFRKAGTEDS